MEMKVKMLAVLALVLLVSNVSEGRILTRCELRSALVAALGGSVPVNTSTSAPVVNATTSTPVDVTANVPENVTSSAPGNVTVPGITTANLTLIAQIVCSVESLSRLNTNLVTPIQDESRPPVRPPVRPPFRPQQRPSERPDGRPGHPGRRPRALARRPGRFSGGRSDSDSSEENSGERLSIITTLFGIFQLSDRVACTSGSVSSLNLCRMNCSALIDNNISDDITCLTTLLNIARNVSVLPFASLPIRRFPLGECLNISPAQYFAACF